MLLHLADLFARADDVLKAQFKRGEYLDILIPLVLIRRLDSIAGDQGLFSSSATVSDIIASLDDAQTTLPQSVNDVLAHFDFANTLQRLRDSNTLLPLIVVLQHLDVSPQAVSNAQMGDWFEEMMRKCIDLNDSFAEYYTPRELVFLLTQLLFVEGSESMSLYDPCAGTGGLLTGALDHIKAQEEANPGMHRTTLDIYGQEINPKTIAIAQADLYLREPTGKWASQIGFGSTLSADQHADKKFDRIIANPPYGFNWSADKDAVEAEYKRGDGRFKAGLPRITDGQFLFFMHMVARMAEPYEKFGHMLGGSRVAIVSSGSPLFTGDATQGEAQIRRYLIENDLIETIIALPEDLFYNTDIATFVWVLSNNKDPRRKGKIQLIDARSFFEPMSKVEGNKRRYITGRQVMDIMKLWQLHDLTSETNAGVLSRHTKVFDNAFFGYRRITIDQPMHRGFEVSQSGLESLKAHKAFVELAKSKKTDPIQKAIEEAQGQVKQQQLIASLAAFVDQSYSDLTPYLMATLDMYKLPTALRNAVLAQFQFKHKAAPIAKDSKGNPEVDSDLRDYEYVPLTESVQDYFEREVLPYRPDAWINQKDRDLLDHQVGIVGYEINFGKLFYTPQIPTPIAEIRSTLDEQYASLAAILMRLTVPQNKAVSAAETD